ncbi:MAG: hypothetical protein CMH54_06130 [Myxococcales bacterium]|nr:hypothetical protein [Myxococcales bacterium]
MDPRERTILILTSASHFMAHFAMLLFPAMAVPIGVDLNISYRDALALSGPGYAAFGLVALPIGFVTTRVSARTLLIIGNGTIGIAALGAALWGDQQNLSWWWLGVGIGAGVYHPVGMTLISNNIRARGRAIGIQGVFGNIGIAGAPLCGALVSYLAGWRWGFGVLGILGFLVFFLLISQRFDESVVAPTSRHQDEVTTGFMGRLKLFLVLALAMVLAGFVYRAFHSLAPKHLGETLLSDAKSIASGKANLWGGVFVGVALLVGTVGQLVGGRLADRIPLVRGYILFHLLSIPFLFGVALLDGFMVPVAAAGFAFFSLGMQPFENSLVARFIPPRWRGVGYGLKFILSFGIGAVGVYYAGWMEARSNAADAVFWLWPSILGILLFGIVILVMERRVEEA